MRSAICSPTRAPASPALVFYQLRGLWKTCHQQLSQFATDLTRQQEAREAARHKSEMRDREESAPRRRGLEAPGGRGRGRSASAAVLAAAQGELDAPDGVLALLQAPPPAEIARGPQAGRADRGCGGRRSARRAQRDQQRGAARVSGHLARCAAQHQSRHHQLRRIAVRARRCVRVWRRAPRRRWRGACTR